MSGKRLIDALKRIGYHDESLSAESVDWLFENECMLPFLEWFCDNLSSLNVLTADEVKCFDELKNSGKEILEGDDLTEALKRLSALATDDNSEDELSEEMEFLMEKKDILEERLDVMVRQRDKMNIMSAESNHRQSRLKELEAETKQNYKKCLEEAYSANDMLNNSLDELSKKVAQFSELYAQPGSNSDRKAASFFSQLSLHDYHKAEEAFTNELTKYTKKQFFDGIAELASGTEKSRYTFLEIRDPTTLFIKGEPKDVTAGEIKQLNRLQAIYPISKMKSIQAEAKNHGVNAAIADAREQLYRLTNRLYTCDSATLREQLKETEHGLIQSRNQIAEMTSNLLSPLVEELGKLQVNKILRGDYDLKIARQDYFISKQDQVINQLMLQRSRYEFLSMIFEVEAQKHRDSHHLLSSVQTLLENESKSFDRRNDAMSNPLLRDPGKSRETIDTRDSTLIRLHSLLNGMDDTGKKPSLFLTYDGLQKKAEELKYEEADVQTQLVNLENSQNENLTTIEQSLCEYLKMLYGGSTTANGLPLLRTKALSNGIDQLLDFLTTLENSVMDVKKDRESKKRVLSADSLNPMERRLFIHFFTNPERLKQTFVDLKARVESQILSEDES